MSIVIRIVQSHILIGVVSILEIPWLLISYYNKAPVGMDLIKCVVEGISFVDPVKVSSLEDSFLIIDHLDLQLVIAMCCHQNVLSVEMRIWDRFNESHCHEICVVRHM